MQPSEKNRVKKCSLFDAAGGFETLRRVHRIFYDKVYVHPWLKQFFEEHNQRAIENRQTAFMAEKLGGPADYWGKQPRMAHRAMYITDELFDIRRRLLLESLVQAGVADPLRRWLRIDEAFRKQVVKSSIADFYHTTWRFEQRVIIPKPSDEYFD